MTPVHLIGAPLDLGGGRRGVDMGPSAIRNANLASRIHDVAEVLVPQAESLGGVCR